MKKDGFHTIFFYTLLPLLLIVTLGAGWLVLIEGHSWNSIVRMFSSPEKSHESTGYEPPDLLALQGQLLDGRYGELDNHFTSLQRDYLAGARPEHEYALAYMAFQTTGPDIGVALDRWVTARQDSAAALVARARYLKHKAWWTGEYAQPGETPTEDGVWEPNSRMYAEARRNLEKAVSLDARNMAAFAGLIEIGHLAGAEGLSQAMRDRGLAIDPLSLVVHHGWVTQLLAGPDGLQAARDYVDSIRPDFARNPLLERLDAQILMHRAGLLVKEGEVYKAVDLLFEVDSAAESAYFLRYRARLLRKTGQQNWAEADLDRAYEYLPHLVATLGERAELFAETGRTELAMKDFALALELDPLNTRTLWKRIKSLYGEGRYREAEADLATSMRLWPDDPMLRFQRGQIRLTKLDDAAGAAEDLAVAIATYPDSPNVWQSYVRALAAIDDCRAVEALAGYLRACEVTESDQCSGSTMRDETRKVEKLAERLACTASG